MQLNKIIQLIIVISLIQGIICACHRVKKYPTCQTIGNCERLYVADGPEDFVFDQWHSPPRLIVSSHERRQPEQFGGIFSLCLTTHASKRLNRLGEDGRFKAYKPHGMDIRREGTHTYLYVILHDPNNRDQRFENVIAVYDVFDHDIQLIQVLENSKCLWSPNDLSVLPDGQIYVTNDCRTLTGLLFRRHSSEIAHYQPKTKTWQIVAKDIFYANGILAQSDRVYISTTLGNELLCFNRTSDGSLSDKKVIAKLKGLDNILPYKDKLLITAHTSIWKFLRHYKKKDALSPCLVYCVDPNHPSNPQNSIPIFGSDGTEISAASTAFIYQNALYVTQVFDPFILRCSPLNVTGRNQ